MKHFFQLQRLFGLICLGIFAFVSSCSNKSSHSTSKSSKFRYAQNIWSNDRGDTVKIYIAQGAVTDSITYILCDSVDVQPNNIAKKIFYVPVPVRRVAALSTTEIACIDQIGQINSIMAVCDMFRVSNSTLQQRFSHGEILDLGTSMNENREKILMVKPQVVVKTLFSLQDIQKDAVLLQQGIPVVYINNWQETNPLGRTEWIKFIGMLYGTQALSDSVFNSIETKYNSLKSLVDTIQDRPKVLAGDMIKDTWFLPGGQSYMAQFIHDAGGDYIFAQNTNTGSAPVNIEQLLGYAKQATVWVGAESLTKYALFQKSESYRYIPVCNTSQCYNYHKRITPQGGNDYWESGTIRADYILADLIHIFHPHVLPTHELVYFKNIE